MGGRGVQLPLDAGPRGRQFVPAILFSLDLASHTGRS